MIIVLYNRLLHVTKIICGIKNKRLVSQGLENRINIGFMYMVYYISRVWSIIFLVFSEYLWGCASYASLEKTWCLSWPIKIEEKLIYSAEWFHICCACGTEFMLVSIDFLLDGPREGAEYLYDAHNVSAFNYCALVISYLLHWYLYSFWSSLCV